MRATTLFLCLMAASVRLAAQTDTALVKRWVGMYREKPLQLEFYDDTMLVVNDRYPLDYRVTGDSLVAHGDTTLVARFRLVLGRLLLEVPGSDVVTMSPQPTIGRPLTGRWIGDLDPVKGVPAEIMITNDRVVRVRKLPSGAWTAGEWEREARKVRFTWQDQVEWIGQYDPIGNAILFDSTTSGSSSTVFRRRYR